MMPYEVRFTDQAQSDLVEIGNFIAIDSPTKAERFLGELVSFAERLLSSFPYAARARYEKYTEVRMIPYRRYNVYYRILESTGAVEVLHIYNGAKSSPYE